MAKGKYQEWLTPDGITRLEALKNAAATFANSVKEKAKGADGTLGTEDDISHRIPHKAQWPRPAHAKNRRQIL